MRKKRISVTDASRNFADCVNRVRYQNATFLLFKGGDAIACLAPHNEKVCVGRDLAKALAGTTLSQQEARAWHRDLQAARRKLKAPRNKWR